jgi:eukaryotic-like serine/threonine-protein kinase
VEPMRAGEVVDGRFEIERAIAEGGMGRVYRAVDLQEGRPVAMKVMLGEHAIDAERFVRESVLLAGIAHPGIVRYVAHGVYRTRPYLVMEWLDGENLALRLVRRPAQRALVGLPAPPDAVTVVDTRKPEERSKPPEHARPVTLRVHEAVGLGQRVAAALGELHQRGVIHRDVKPSNLFLCEGLVERVKLLDFGTARPAEPNQPLTITGARIGTPLYMAPEQARGSDNLTPATDIWALGCVLYECLTGVAPFCARDTLAILARIVIEDVVPPRVLRPDIPEALDTLVVSMLAKEQENRPADGHVAAEALRVLRESLSDDSTTAPSQPRPEAPRAPSLPATASALTGETRVCALLFAQSRTGSIDCDAVDRVMDRFGTPWDRLMDKVESLVVQIRSQAAPKDQAAVGARIALGLREALPGLAMALVMGREERGEKTPYGDGVWRGVMELQAAEDGEIRVDPLMSSLLEARFHLNRDGAGARLLGAQELEGVRTLLGRPTPWVGRRRELATLLALYDEVSEDRVARVALVTAPPGMGKTRLRQELVRALDARGEPYRILLGQGDALSAGSPFLLVGPALRRAAGIQDGEPIDTQRHKLESRLERSVLPADAGAILPFLGELAGVPFPEDEALRAARSDPMLLGQRIQKAWEAFIAAECRSGPVVLVLEDIHWGDLPSIKLVDGTLRSLADSPLFVVALARPEVQNVFPGLWEQRGLQELPLHPLTPRASAELVRSALGNDANESTVQAVVERAGGNAFFLEELIRAASEGLLESLPDTVLGMVQLRLDSLAQEARRVLRAGSLFGEVFWRGGVHALLGTWGAFDPVEWLDDLVAREVLTRHAESRVPGEVEYGFRHALVRDAAYETLTPDDRTAGHLRVGEWLLSAGERDALVLAEHFDRGGDKAAAVKWMTRAAEQALEGNDLAAVVHRADRAIAAGAKDAALGTLLGLKANAAYWQSRYADALAWGQGASELLSRGSTEWFRALGVGVVSAARVGEGETLVRLFAVITGTEAREGSETAQLQALCRGTFQLLFASRFEEADRVVARVTRVFQAASGLDALTVAQVNHVLGLRAAQVGDVRTFLVHLERAVAAFERAGDTRNVSLERTTVAWCWAEIGDFARAETLCRENLAWCLELGAPQAVTYAKVNLGYILGAGTDKLDEARQVLLEAVAECSAVSNARLEGWARAHLSSVELKLEGFAASEEHARRAVDLLLATPGLHAWAEACLARALVRLGRATEARALVEHALTVLERQDGLLQGETTVALAALEVHEALDDGELDKVRARARERLAARAERLQNSSWSSLFLSHPDSVRIRAAS